MIIVDFYCAQQRLIVELDGAIHAKQREADRQRASQLTAHGYRVLRFNNQEVESELEAVLERIAAACGVSALLPGNLGEGQAGVRPDES